MRRVAPLLLSEGGLRGASGRRVGYHSKRPLADVAQSSARPARRSDARSARRTPLRHCLCRRTLVPKRRPSDVCMTKPSHPPSPDSRADPNVDPAADVATPSKTRRKHAMHALQDLGEALLAIDPKRLEELELPERLFDALLQARGIRAHEGRRRQIQYIGKLMRDIDPVPLQAALARWTSGSREDNARFAVLERWRDELMRDDEALDRFLAAHPEANRAEFAALVRDARDERRHGGPPHRFRELFRQLKAVLDAPRASSPSSAQREG